MARGDRVCYRLKREFPVVFQRSEGPDRFYAVSTDISTSGIGILTERGIEKETLLDLELYLPGRLQKLRLKGRVMFQKPVQRKRKTFLLTGIRFEDLPEAASNAITKFVAGNLRMLGLRMFVLLAGGAAITASLARAFFYTSLGLFRNTSFGKEWVDAPWNSLPLTGIAAAHAGFAIFGLIACLSFFFMRKRASLAVLIFAGAGFFTQIARCALKSSYFFQGSLNTRIFWGELGILFLFGVLAWAMLQKGGNYERILDSIHEDLGFKPAQPDPAKPPQRPRVSIFRI